MRDVSVDARKAQLAATEISLLVLLVASVAVAQAFPFKSVKYGLMVFLGVVMLIQTTRRPAIGLAMLAFVVPAVDIVAFSVPGIRALNAETIVLALGLYIWSRASAVGGKDGFGPPLGRFVFVYALLILVSCFVSYLTWRTSLVDLLASAKNHLTYMIFLPVAFHTLREKRDQWLLVGAISLSLLLNHIQGIHGSWHAFLAGSLERHRAMAIFAIQPNAFAAAISMYLPLIVIFALNKVSNRAAQLWFLLGAAAAGFCLLLTLSRGGWMGAALGLAVVALFRERKLLVLLAILAASYQVWVPQAAIDRVELTANNDAGTDRIETDDQMADNSTEMRIQQYRSLPAMMAPRPILGWGYKSFPQVFEKYGTLRRAKGAHSSYCQLGTEGGAVGLTMLIVVLAGMAWAGFEGARVTTDPFHRWLGVAVLGGTVAMAVCMGSGARFEPQKLFAFFWIMIGIVQRESVLARRAAAQARHAAGAIVTSRRAMEDPA